MTEESRSKKDSLRHITFIIIEYGMSDFSARSDASLLTVTEAEGPIPPLVDITSGVNISCSTLIILLSYFLLFSISCLR